jgi:hypothetical protein
MPGRANAPYTGSVLKEHDFTGCGKRPVSELSARKTFLRA